MLMLGIGLGLNFQMLILTCSVLLYSRDVRSFTKARVTSFSTLQLANYLNSTLSSAVLDYLEFIHIEFTTIYMGPG